MGFLLYRAQSASSGARDNLNQKVVENNLDQKIVDP